MDFALAQLASNGPAGTNLLSAALAALAAALRFLLGELGSPIDFELAAERGVRIEGAAAPSQ